MKKQAPQMLLFCVLLAGCSATRGPTTMNQLQIQVAQMERQLADRDQEIEELKFTVQDLSSQVQDMEASQISGSMEDVGDSYSQENIASSFKSVAKDEQVIRVAASPKQVQTALKSAGYYTGSIDGKIGGGSKKAIKDFQKDHQLKSDGVVGKRTWQELKNYLD